MALDLLWSSNYSQRHLIGMLHSSTGEMTVAPQTLCTTLQGSYFILRKTTPPCITHPSPPPHPAHTYTHTPPSNHLITHAPFAISHSIKPWIIQSRWNWFLDSLIANQNRTLSPVRSLRTIFDNQIFMEKWNVSRSFLLLAD